MSNFKEKLWGDQSKQATFSIKDHTILYGYRGSKAHNLYIPSEEDMSTDDIDWMGIVIAPIDYYFGIYHFEGTEHWEGKDDVVIYELRKFIRLLLKANPNVLSFLWNKPEMFTHCEPIAQELIDNRDLFSTKQAFKSFGGYSKSQLHKMFHQNYQGYMGDKRKKLVDKFGYDVKNASHLIRLLRMGIEFLSTGQLTVYRENDRQELIDIKQGKWSAKKVEELGNDLFNRLQDACNASPLPKQPNYHKINNLLVGIMRKYYANIPE